MGSYKISAINIKSYNLGESDKIMVMYSQEKGLVRGVAKGVKKPKSSLGGRMQLIVANRLLMAEGRNLDVICQSETIDSFSALRTDINKLSYSFYCAELLANFGLENDYNSEAIYCLAFEAFKNIALSSCQEDILWTTIRFKLKLAEQLGYAIELDNCVVCNDIGNYSLVNPENTANIGHSNDRFRHFCYESGGVICCKCTEQNLKSTKIRHPVVKYAEFDKRQLKIYKDAQNFDFPETKVDIGLLFSCFNSIKEYMSVRSDRKFKTSEMIEMLCC